MTIRPGQIYSLQVEVLDVDMDEGTAYIELPAKLGQYSHDRAWISEEFLTNLIREAPLAVGDQLRDPSGHTYEIKLVFADRYVLWDSVLDNLFVMFPNQIENLTRL